MRCGLILDPGDGRDTFARPKCHCRWWV